jgi:hypothetical protein
VSVVIAYARRRKTWGPVIAGIVLIPLAVLAGLTTLVTYFPHPAVSVPVGTDNPHPGLGIYAEAAAGFLMLIGGWQIRRPRDQNMIVMSLVLVVAAVLIVRLLVNGASFGPYPGGSVSRAPG